MALMISREYEFDWTADRPLTVDDLEHTPDDGRRYELDNGRLDVSPAPSVSIRWLNPGFNGT